MSNIQPKNSRRAKKYELAYNEEENQLETYSEIIQMIELRENDVKITMIIPYVQICTGKHEKF